MPATYDPGLNISGEGWLTLHRNENLFVDRALLDEVGKQALHGLHLATYPHPTSLALRERLAELYGVDAENVFVGNGSDEVLSDLLQLLRQSYPAMWVQDVSYAVYPMLAARFSYRLERIPGRTFFSGRIEAPQEPRLSVIDSPNAITGGPLSQEDLRTLARLPGSFLVWDNAYGEIAGDEMPREIQTNRAIVRSFSKFYGLAGARVGYCIGDRALIAELLQRKDVFNVNSFSHGVALAALERRELFLQAAREMLAAREKLVSALQALGFEVRKPSGSFVLARHPSREGSALHRQLAERLISVRRFPGELTEEFLRITVPPQAGLDRLAEALQTLLGRGAA